MFRRLVDFRSEVVVSIIVYQLAVLLDFKAADFIHFVSHFASCQLTLSLYKQLASCQVVFLLKHLIERSHQCASSS